jgi:hypothetical protein
VAAIDVTEADVATYERDGVVCLRRVFAPRWIELLAEGVEADIRITDPGFRISI